MSTQLVKKITARDVLGVIKSYVREHGAGKKDGDIIDGFTIIGQCMGHTTGESSYGPWIKLKGRFRATNKITGDVFNSAACMLPDEAQDPLLAVLQIDGAQSVDMAFDIDLKIDDSAAVGYVYVVTPLMQPAEDDPLERLASTVSAGNKLPAPKKEAAK